MIRLYPVKTFNIFKSIFHKWIWSIETPNKEIYLTFDDGPIPEITPWVLKVLKKHKAKATFFCIGDNIQKHPTVFQQIINEHHKIGNHTFHHLKGWNTNTQKYIDNTIQCEKKIPAQSSRLFRPPYGRISLKQASKLRKLGYTIVMWDVLSADFDKQLNAKNCINNVLKNVKNGSIIVFHDSEKAFPRLKKALPVLLEQLSKKGYTFKTIP